ncbi:MAG: hypothetical protein AB1345_09790 [Chloroflexota bacterium]
MSKLTGYYFSRFVISIVLGGLFLLTGAAWWQALIAVLGSFAWFLWAPHSGRYVVRTEKGATALHRDERTQRITNQAGRNAWVIVTVLGGGLASYYGFLAIADMPVSLLGLLLLSGVITFFASDYILRRRG